MARPLRVEFPGAVYHITSRGNARGDIFADDGDRSSFLATLAAVVAKYRWVCHAYCLMDNHYHLLVETPEGVLSRGMRQLNGVYTQQYNRRHHLVGHLLQGRYKSFLVEKESYLLELCRYIVLNPVRANMANMPGNWRWSSFSATSGQSPPPRFLALDWLLSQFGESPVTARRRYLDFILDGMGNNGPWEDLRGGFFLGGEDFVERIRDRLAENIPEEIPKSQRLAHRPGLETVFASGANNEELARKAYEAHDEWGYTLKEIGAFLGLHYATVSKIVRRARDKMWQGKT